jgi:DNA-binding transcriptional LysR family regulator
MTGGFCQIQSRRSRWLVEHVLTRQIDVAISPARIDNPNFVVERFAELPLVCIMPPGHPLADHRVVRPEHLTGTRFVAFDLDSQTGQKVDGVLQEHNIEPKVVITTDAVNSVSEFVAAGLGVALTYPLFVYGMRDCIIARPFDAKAPLDQYLIYSHEARNLPLILDFAKEVRNTATAITTLI